MFLMGDGTRGPRVKLIDFGLAIVMASLEETPILFIQGSEATSPASADLTGPETVIGTPGYQAPEVLAGRAPTTAADVYAFGVLMSRSSLLDKCDAALSAILAGEPAARPASARLAVETVGPGIRRRLEAERRPGREESLWKHGGFNGLAWCAKMHQPPQLVLQLAYVSRPRISLKSLESFDCHAANRLIGLGRVLAEEVLDQEGYIFAAIAQRRDPQHGAGHPIVEITPELLAIDPL